MKITGMVRSLTLLSLTILTFLTKCQAGPVRSQPDTNSQQNRHPPIVFDSVDRIYKSGPVIGVEGQTSQTGGQSGTSVRGEAKKDSINFKAPVIRTKRATLPVPLMSIRMAPIELYGLQEGGNSPFEERERRKFPEVDSRGFDEDIFDEGFGEFHPMKRWPH